jgi:hypothetical protein
MYHKHKVTVELFGHSQYFIILFLSLIALSSKHLKVPNEPRSSIQIVNVEYSIICNLITTSGFIPYSGITTQNPPRNPPEDCSNPTYAATHPACHPPSPCNPATDPNQCCPAGAAPAPDGGCAPLPDAPLSVCNLTPYNGCCPSGTSPRVAGGCAAVAPEGIGPGKIGPPILFAPPPLPPPADCSNPDFAKANPDQCGLPGGPAPAPITPPAGDCSNPDFAKANTDQCGTGIVGPGVVGPAQAQPSGNEPSGGGEEKPSGGGEEKPSGGGEEKAGEPSAIPSQITRTGIGIMIPSLGNVGATTSSP